MTDAVAFASRAFLGRRKGVLPQSAMLRWGPPVVSPSTAKVALLHLHQLLFARLVTHLEVLQPTDQVRQEG